MPVIDGHDLTREALARLGQTAAFPQNIHVYIIDNNSARPYRRSDIPKVPFPVTILRNDFNVGYYYPIVQLSEKATAADQIGLMHNDVFVYGEAWDYRLTETFVFHSQIGLVGFCGSDEVDERGGRGGGTMCNFRGERGPSAEATGKRVGGLHPAILLDSLFMVMRAVCVPLLEVDERIVPCHFYDKIWPMRLYVKGWHTAVAGVEIDHMGGQTAVGMLQRFSQDCREWCGRVGMDAGEDPALTVYLEAERRFLSEFREQRGLIPGRLVEWRLDRY